MYLSGYKNLELIRRLYKNIPKSKIDEVLKIVKLEKRKYDKVNRYSLGMRQRLGIASSLIHEPNILILDEPTNGLDPKGIKELRDLLKYLASKKKMGILISSHNLSELESFCNKVCLISKGRVIETKAVQEFKHEDVKNTYLIEVDNPKKAVNYLSCFVINNNFIKFKSSKEDIPELLKTLILENIKIYSLKEVELTLEEAFLNKVGGDSID